MEDTKAQPDNQVPTQPPVHKLNRHERLRAISTRFHNSLKTQTNIVPEKARQAKNKKRKVQRKSRKTNRL